MKTLLRMPVIKESRYYLFLSLALICIFTLSCRVAGQSVVYIDPGFAGSPKSGTLQNPFTDFPTLSDNTTYLLKGGSTLVSARTYGGTGNSIVISTYGTGRAYIVSSVAGAGITLSGNSNLIENINLTMTASNQVSAQGFQMIINGGKGEIRNCKAVGGLQGINGGHYGTGTGVFYVTGCTVTATTRDGVYIDHLDSLVFRHDSVYNINLNHALDYGGDCLQTETVKYVSVDSCFFDHSSTPGKYCMIDNGYLRARISNTTMIGGINEACIYPGGGDSGNMNTYVTNCLLIGAMRGIQDRADSLVLKNVIIKSPTTYGIEGGITICAYNCDFIDMPTGLFGGDVSHKVLKNSIFYNVPTPCVGTQNLYASNNLYYDSQKPLNEAQKSFIGNDVIEKDPMFKDGNAGDYSLTGESPCINAGDNNVPVSYDIRYAGRPSPAESRIDIGTYEYISQDAEKPVPPGDLESTDITYTGFTLTWTAATDNVGISGYDIFIDGHFLKSETGLSADISGLTQGSAYKLTLKARDIAGNASPSSDTLEVTTPASADTEPPKPPASLASSAIAKKSFMLNWTPSTDNIGVASYDVYRDGKMDTSVTTTSVLIDGLFQGTGYDMMVRARDQVGNISSWSDTLHVITSSGCTSSDSWSNQGIANQDGSAGLAVIEYDVVPSGNYMDGVTGVSNGTLSSFGSFAAIVRFNNKGFIDSWSSTTGYHSIDSTLYFEAISYHVKLIINLQTKTYDAFVKQESASDYTVIASGYGFRAQATSINNFAEVTTSCNLRISNLVVSSIDNIAPSVPSGLEPGNITVTGLTLSWDPSSDNEAVTGYDIYIDGDLYASVPGTTAEINGLTGGTHYTLTVRAKDAAGNISEASDPLDVQTQVITGVSDINLNSVQVYPNPATTWISIRVGQKSQLTLYNIVGNVLIFKTIEKGQTTLPLRLPSGLYLINISGEAGGQYSGKLIIN